MPLPVKRNKRLPRALLLKDDASCKKIRLTSRHLSTVCVGVDRLKPILSDFLPVSADLKGSQSGRF